MTALNMKSARLALVMMIAVMLVVAAMMMGVHTEIGNEIARWQINSAAPSETLNGVEVARWQINS